MLQKASNTGIFRSYPVTCCYVKKPGKFGGTETGKGKTEGKTIKEHD